MKNIAQAKRKIKWRPVAAVAAVIALLLNSEIVTLIFLLIGGAAAVCWLFTELAREENRTHYGDY